MFANDVDLYAFDPLPFREFTHLGRHVLGATAQIDGNAAIFSQPDIPLSSCVAAQGDILMMAGRAYELLGPIASNQAQLSLPRARGEALIPPAPTAAQPAMITSFASQRMLVGRRMLVLAGISPDDSDAVARISNAEALVDVQTLGTLALLYRTAAVLLPEDAPLNIRSRELQRAFEQLRERTPIRMDACVHRSIPNQTVRG